MRWRRFLRVLLEPAKDPLRDSFGISIERVRALRIRLNEQLAGLRSRAGSLEDPAFTIQIGELQAEHDRLVELERRVSTRTAHAVTCSMRVRPRPWRRTDCRIFWWRWTTPTRGLPPWRRQ